MVGLIDIQLDVVKKFEKIREKFIKNAKELKRIASNLFKNNLHAVYVFGSVVKGKTHAMSDIDVAVVLLKPASENERIRLYKEVRKKFGLLHPFEIHVVTKDEWDGWYRKFVKEDFVEV